MIGDSVFCPGWNERILVGFQSEIVISDRDRGFAFDNYPMFASALVHLQAESMSGIYLDAFDFVSVAFGEYLEHSPGSLVSLYFHDEVSLQQRAEVCEK